MEAISNPEGDYVWDVMGARVLTTQLISANSLSGNVGQGGSQFKLIFKDNFLLSTILQSRQVEYSVKL